MKDPFRQVQIHRRAKIWVLVNQPLLTWTEPAPYQVEIYILPKIREIFIPKTLFRAFYSSAWYSFPFLLTFYQTHKTKYSQTLHGFMASKLPTGLFFTIRKVSPAKRQHHKSEKPQIARDFHQGLVNQVSQDFDKKTFQSTWNLLRSHRTKIQAFYQLLESIGSKLKQSVFKHLALKWS